MNIIHHQQSIPTQKQKDIAARLKLLKFKVKYNANNECYLCIHTPFIFEVYPGIVLAWNISYQLNSQQSTVALSIKSILNYMEQNNKNKT